MDCNFYLKTNTNNLSFKGLLRKSAKGKYQVNHPAASTPATSDDEMETSFSSLKTATEKGLVNPMYEGDVESSGSDSPRLAEDALESTGRKQRGDAPEIRVR